MLNKLRFFLSLVVYFRYLYINKYIVHPFEFFSFTNLIGSENYRVKKYLMDTHIHVTSLSAHAPRYHVTSLVSLHMRQAMTSREAARSQVLSVTFHAINYLPAICCTINPFTQSGIDFYSKLNIETMSSCQRKP